MELTIKSSRNNEIVDLTGKINSLLSRENVKEGLCNVFVAHTTCAVTTADLDPGTDLDFLEAIEKIFPEGKYRHPHDPSHVGEHIMSSIIGASVLVPVKSGKLVLGTWQQVVLVELSGPRERKVVISII